MLFEIILIIFFALGLTGLFLYFKKRMDEISETKKGDQSLLLLNQNIQGIEQKINSQINQLASNLGELTEVGRDIKSFSEFLKSPKLRGNIGEEILQDLLEQYFSKEHFALQYKFKSGERVDAILKTREGIIPIDAKFPLENFQKWNKANKEEEKKIYFKAFINDVKKHIDKISQKYILPEEGTVDFAVMYIPSETIYYELIGRETDISEFSRRKRVYFTSPNSFYYFLKVIMMSMQGEKIQENSKKILEVLEAIRVDSLKFAKTLKLVSSHFNNAEKALNEATNEYRNLSLKIDQIKLLK
ncbi:MAG: DNA recombination protein RmuC [Parcubacteria group bacterium ADurb.Bin159]|jgi:DNA recombination protein RmuC|nr:MAG: DNA recombination protein RmuC [Parcubacteria group bacterium ADurb.Bin159]